MNDPEKIQGDCLHLNLKNEPGFTCADCGATFITTEEKIENLEKQLNELKVENERLRIEVSNDENNIKRLHEAEEQLTQKDARIGELETERKLGNIPYKEAVDMKALLHELAGALKRSIAHEKGTESYKKVETVLNKYQSWVQKGREK